MNHYRRLLLLCSALLFSPGCSEEQQLKRLEAELISSRNQGELNIRSYELSRRLEEKLQRLEDRIKKNLEGPELELFQESAGVWRVYLDTQVAFEASAYEGGTIQPLMANTAAMRLINERINALAERDPQSGH